MLGCNCEFTTVSMALFPLRIRRLFASCKGGSAGNQAEGEKNVFHDVRFEARK